MGEAISTKPQDSKKHGDDKSIHRDNSYLSKQFLGYIKVLPMK